MKLSEFLNTDEITLLNDTIKIIEKKTKSKIRIYVMKKMGKNPMEKAREIFIKLNLRENKLKNNVLFLISLNDKKIAILGDDGIAEKVNENLWKHIINAVVEKFKNREFLIGITGGINMIAEKVIEHFPDDKNENSLEQIVYFEE